MTDWINKEQMKRAFNAAATRYDQAAELQRKVAQLVLKNVCDTNNKTVLDVGSGTGYLSQQLFSSSRDSATLSFCSSISSSSRGLTTGSRKNKKLLDPVVKPRDDGTTTPRYDELTYPISIDISENMLRFSKQTQASQSYVCNDAECLCFSSESVDVILSSMALHWCQNIKKAFSELSRVLKKKGQLFFAILGENSLNELRHCWKTIDTLQHVNNFPSQSAVQNTLESSFSKIDLQTHTIIQYHDSIYTLMNKLKMIGAHNVTNKKPNGLTGKNKLRALENAYEAYRNQDHLLPATYEIIVGVCKK